MRPVVVVCVSLALASAGAGERTFIADGESARVLCGAAPFGWQRAELDDSGWSARVTRVTRGDAGAPLEVATPDAGAGFCGARFLRWHFSADEAARALTLVIRLRYTHGFAAYLNGVEVARRRLAPDAPPGGLASDVHGPEYERFTARGSLLKAGDNLFAVEVHPRTAGRDTTIELSLEGHAGPRIVRGPYLVGAGGHGATVVFDTDVPTRGALRWGATPSYGASARDELGLHHALSFGALEPGRVYHYRAHAGGESDGVDSDDFTFHLPPDGGRALRFVVYGDVRSGHEIHAALNRALLAEAPDFALLTGDLVDRGSDEGDWERFFEIAGPLVARLPIFPALGNHEYVARGQGLRPSLDAFRPRATEPYYSFDFGGAHFVALDSAQYKLPRQLAWLERDLDGAERRRARAIFVYAHEGPASSGLHGDNAICARDYVPVMVRHHVSMFFGGHDHDYERGKTGALDYVVTGGGGAELRAPRCGVEGRPPCGARVRAFANEHNYVMVELLPALFRVCPKRVDGSPLEACTQYPLR